MTRGSRMKFATFMKKLFRAESRPEKGKLKRIQSIEEFYGILERERCRADRSGMPFALISFDVKKINENAKNKLQQVICTRMRLTDEAGWIDHQHIGLLLYNTNGQIAWSIANKILTALPEERTYPDYTVYSYPTVNYISADGNKKEAGSQEKECNQSKNMDLGNASISCQPSMRNTNDPENQFTLKVQHSYKGTFDDIKPLLARRIPLWKRSLDIIGSLVALIALSPIFLFIGLLIKIVSPGPAFFKQVRIGAGGKKFKMWKFRTMENNADPSIHQRHIGDLYKKGKPLNKLDNDPRIIPFGDILRKTCLDELPQFINVLTGDMSLVGPRPDVEYAVKEYDYWHFARFDVTPGMTGLWQISGKNNTSLRRMVSFDLNYKRKRSFWNDLKILTLTLPAVLLDIGITIPTRLRNKFLVK